MKVQDEPQEVVVGQVALRALAVVVTTLDGVPVKGATVHFRSAADSKPTFVEGPSVDLFPQELDVKTDDKGVARARVRPDTNIRDHAILRPGTPNEELFGLNWIMAETSAPGGPTVALPTPFTITAKHDVPAQVEMRCPISPGLGYCGFSFEAGLQMGLTAFGRVVDKIRELDPERLGDVDVQPVRRTVRRPRPARGRRDPRPGRLGRGTDVFAHRLHRNRRPRVHGLHPGLLGDVPSAAVDLVLTVPKQPNGTETTGRYRIYVSNPAGQTSPPCVLKPRRNPTFFDGVYLSKFPTLSARRSSPGRRGQAGRGRR